MPVQARGRDASWFFLVRCGLAEVFNNAGELLGLHTVSMLIHDVADFGGEFQLFANAQFDDE